MTAIALPYGHSLISVQIEAAAQVSDTMSADLQVFADNHVDVLAEQAAQFAPYAQAPALTGISAGTGGGITSSTATSNTTVGGIYINSGCTVFDVLGDTGAESQMDALAMQALPSWLKLKEARKKFTLEVGKSGRRFAVEMPDGHVIDVDDAGNFRVLDKDAKVTYKANTQREFNRFLNASDLLAEFIKDLGMVGATQQQVLKVPIELFINWLVVRAAEQDEEELPPDLPKLEDIPKLLPPESVKTHQCKHCGRFISPERTAFNFPFCNGAHADVFFSSRKRPTGTKKLPIGAGG